MTEKLAPIPSLDELMKEFDDWLQSAEEQEKIELALQPEQLERADQFILGLPERRDRLGFLFARLEQEREAAMKGAARYNAYAKRMVRRLEWVKLTMKTAMECKGYVAADGREFTFRIHKNPTSVRIVNESDIPEEYCDLVRVPNKIRIMEALQKGTPVPGCILITDRTRLDVRGI